MPDAETLAAAKDEAARIPADRRERLDAAFDRAPQDAQRHSAFRRPL